MNSFWIAVLSATVGSIAGVIANLITLKHRLQAENEYAILIRIWHKAYWLKSRANNLRPIHDSGNPNAPEEKKKRLDAFDRAKEEFDEEMYLNRPFYPDEIRRCLRELGNDAAFESIDYYFHDATPDDAKYWEAAKASAEKIDSLVDRLCDSIRCRIHGYLAYRIRQGLSAPRKGFEWLLSLIKWPLGQSKSSTG